MEEVTITADITVMNSSLFWINWMLHFTQEDRVSAFVEAQQILADDAPAIWMYANDNVTLVNSKLENVTVFPIDYYLVTKQVDIS